MMTTRFLNGIALVDVRGALAAGAAADGLSLPAAVAELADGGFAEIAVNLAAVSQLDAYGLGQLVLARHAAHDRGAQLMLVSPPPRVRRMLSLTRLDTVCPVWDTEAGMQDDYDRFRISCATLASSTSIFSSAV